MQRFNDASNTCKYYFLLNLDLHVLYTCTGTGNVVTNYIFENACVCTDLRSCRTHVHVSLSERNENILTYYKEQVKSKIDDKTGTCPLPDPSDNTIQAKFKDTCSTDVAAVVSTLIFSSSIEPV